MNKMKRVFSFVLAFTIMLGTFGSFAPVFANEVAAPKAEPKAETKVLKEVPKDVIGTEHEDAVRRLVAFGIIGGYPDGTYKPENIVNRAEFSKMIVEALGQGDAVVAAKTKSTGFSDIYSGHWATGHINVANGLGLIKGYPDGTFKPAQDVTYAEALTMLVRALGYKDEFLSGSWPGNYVSQAATSGITDGVNIPSDAGQGGQRGYIAGLLNNTLDAKVVKVDKYTQGRVDYYETDIPLLKDRLEISKYEDTRIIADKVVNDGLEKNELTLRFLEDSEGYGRDSALANRRGEIVKKTYRKNDRKDFRFKDGVEPREVIGEEVTTYINDREEIIFVERENDDKAYFDFVDEIDKGNLSLVNFDKSYDFESDKDIENVIHVYNTSDDTYDEITDPKSLKEEDREKLVGRMGKVVVRNNRIVYAEFMDTTEAPDWLLVMENDNGLVKGINRDIEDFELDLRSNGNYDGVLAFDTKGKTIDVKDIAKGDVLYVEKLDYDKDDYAHVVAVKENQVTGELGRVREDRIFIDDKSIKVARYTPNAKDNDSKAVELAFYTVDGLEDIKVWEDSDWENDMEDAYKEEVTAYKDAFGKVVFFTTDVDAKSGYKFGVVTRTYADKDRVKIYTTIDGKEGKDQVFKADRESDIENPILLDANGQIETTGKDKTPKTKFYTSEDLIGKPVKFKLNKDGEISKDEFFVQEYVWKMEDGKDFGKNTMRLDAPKEDVKKASGKDSFSISNNVDIIDAEGVWPNYVGTTAGTSQNIETYNKAEWLNSEITKSNKNIDIDDFGIAKWEDMKEDSYDEQIRLALFTKKNKSHEAEGMVFIGPKGASTSSDAEAIYLIERWRKGDDIVGKYVSYEDGKEVERVVGSYDYLSDIARRDVYVAKVKSNGDLDIQTSDKADGLTKHESHIVTEVSARTVKFAKYEDKKVDLSTEKSYNLPSNAVVWERDNKKTTSNLRVGHVVNFVEEDRISVRAIGIKNFDNPIKDVESGKPGEGPSTIKGKKIEAINITDDIVKAIHIDGKTYKLADIVTFTDSEGETNLLTPKELADAGGKAKELVKGAYVDIKTEDDKIVEIVIKTTKTDASKAVLKDEVKKAEALDSNIKTEEGVAEAITEAKKILEKKDATEKEISDATEAIKDAVKAVEETVKEATDYAAKVKAMPNAVTENDKVKEALKALNEALDADKYDLKVIKEKQNALKTLVDEIEKEEEKLANVKAVKKEIEKLDLANSLKIDGFKEEVAKEETGVKTEITDYIKAKIDYSRVTIEVVVEKNGFKKAEDDENGFIKFAVKVTDKTEDDIKDETDVIEVIVLKPAK